MHEHREEEKIGDGESGPDGTTETNAERTLRSRGRPFRPGQSGNLRGRPTSPGIFRELCRTQAPAAVDALMRAATEGGPVGVTAAKLVLEYGFGRAPDEPLKMSRR